MAELERRDYLQSLERGLAVMLAFSRNRPRMTLSEVATETGLSKPTVRRILLTLEHLGYVRSDARLFTLTPRVLGLGYAYLSSLNLTETAQPVMETLTDQTGEDTALATLDRTDVVYATRVPRHRITGLPLAVGTRLPAHATSMGHVLLAGLGEGDLDRYFAEADLRPLTARTLTTRERLLDRLGLVRRQGWALVDQELEEGRRSLAAPVRDATGNVIAALALSTSSADRSVPRLVEEFLPPLTKAATAISEALGAHWYGRRAGPPPA